MTTKSSSPAIKLSGLRKEFGAITAVDGINLTVDRGEIVAFLGPNGAGKTTTLDMVLGLCDPTAGSVDVLGLSPREAVTDGRVAAVLQTGGLLPTLKVRETVRLIASLFESTAPVDEVIERAGIANIADRMVGKCSGGEKQRLRFALALLPEPDLLILDEPTAGMDVNARRHFWETMQTEASHGRTVVFATHYLEEANAFAERIVMIADGRVIADGATDDIRAQASGRILSVDSDDADGLARRLRAQPGVGHVEVFGHRVSAQTASEGSDALARVLLADPDARELEISSGSLENAFVALTTEEQIPEGVAA